MKHLLSSLLLLITLNLNAQFSIVPRVNAVYTYFNTGDIDGSFSVAPEIAFSYTSEGAVGVEFGAFYFSQTSEESIQGITSEAKVANLFSYVDCKLMIEKMSFHAGLFRSFNTNYSLKVNGEELDIEKPENLGNAGVRLSVEYLLIKKLSLKLTHMWGFSATELIGNKVEPRNLNLSIGYYFHTN